MTERHIPPDLDKYRPDEATAEKVMNGPLEYNRDIDPELRARHRALSRLSSNPGAAPPSEAVEYVPPTELRAARTPARDEPRVKVALPPSRNESPTQPSLRRIEGEPEVPGVVRAPSPGARGLPRPVVFVLLAVLIPVLAVFFFRGLVARQPDPNREVPAASATVGEPAAMLSAVTSSVPAVQRPTPSEEPSATASPRASASASPAGHAPIGVLPKHPPHAGTQEPHDAPPAPPNPVPTAAPTETPRPAATPAPAPAATPGAAPVATTPTPPAFLD